MKPAIPGTFRHTARLAITQVIADHVLGPGQLLPKEDVLELRRVLRDHYPFVNNTISARRVWREEIRTALGYADPKPRKKRKKPFKIERHLVMPSMRAWAEKRGILAE